VLRYLKASTSNSDEIRVEGFWVKFMWIWLVAGFVLFFLLIFARTPLREIENRCREPSDKDDELLEEFLIIDLLDEEEEE
jgi:hypothetical protein